MIITEQEFINIVKSNGYGDKNCRIKVDYSKLAQHLGENLRCLVTIRVYGSQKDRQDWVDPILVWQDGAVIKDTVGIF